jgi:hypothetical protein
VIDTLLGEEFRFWLSANPMKSMIYGREGRQRNAELICEVLVLVSGELLRVEIFMILRIIDMKLIWTDSNDRA